MHKGRSSRSSKFRIEINAGKCIYDGNIIKPDKRKGKLRLYRASDELLHMQWINRETNKVEDDLIVIEDVFLKKIEECKTGRVYLLKFIVSDKKMFFWMQDFDDSKDEAFVRKFNAATGHDTSKESNSKREKQSTISSINEKPVKFPYGDDSLNYLLDPKKTVTFKDLFNDKYLYKLLDIPEVVDELKTHMPEGYQTKEDIIDAIQKRAFNTSLSFFDSTLFTHFNFLLHLLELPLPTEEVKDPMEYIIKSLNKKYNNEQK